jgi:deoxycytidine triphosphate deaminase
MLKTGKEIDEKYLKISKDFHKINQVGVDLSVNKIEKISGMIMVLKDKTVVNPESFIICDEIEIDGRIGWRLSPGAYALTFNEGIRIPANVTGFIQSRSSIYRGGSIISSPVWDPGFECEVMGTTMIVNEMIFIEKNARVCQLIMHENHEPSELYNGQFQNKTNY